MKLRDLNAAFLAYESPTTFRHVDTLAEADGIIHLCHVCFQRNNGPKGTHSMLHWFRGRVPDDLHPGPGRWTPEGTGIDDLSFVPGNPVQAHSVLQEGHAHFFITNGEIIEA